MAVSAESVEAHRERLLKSANLAPPFSPILNRMIASLAKEDVRITEISELAEKDTALAGNLLRTVNSSLYGMAGSINSVGHAVAILGLEKVRNVALTMSLVRLWRRDPGVPGWSPARFNLHSAAAAIMADLLVQHLAAEYPEGAFTAGLFHDFGKLLVATELPLEFSALRARVEQEGRDQTAAERESLGIAHAELSSAALERWNFPAPIVEAVRAHHAEDWKPGPPMPLAAVVNAADRCVNRMGLSVLSHHPELAGEPADVLGALGLEAKAPRLLSEFNSELETVRTLF